MTSSERIIILHVLGKAVYMYMLMRDEEGRKKEASKVKKQQSKATQHTQGSNFSKDKLAYIYMILAETRPLQWVILYTSRPICCFQLRELWFIDFIMYIVHDEPQLP